MPELRMSDRDVCDFCSDPHPVRWFQAPDFMMEKGTPSLGSRGAWAACQECGEFIDAGKWDALQLRAEAALTKKYAALPAKVVREQIVKAHSLFRKHMWSDV